MIDDKKDSGIDWQNLSPEEKKKELYLKQKAMLDMFFERNAISRAQYDKSLSDLTEKWECKTCSEVECMAPFTGICRRGPVT